jgi:phage shock protein C
MNNAAKPAPLRRSRRNKMIAGVMGGLGEHYEIDPVKLRLAYVLLTLFTAFAGVIVYLIAWFLIPEEESMP